MIEMADKTNFLLYKDNKSAVMDLTDKNAGQLFKAIYSWVNGREEYPIDDVGTKAIFEYVFKKHLEKDLIKYKEIIKRNQENGKKGGRPKTQKTQSVLKEPKKADNDIVIDTDIDNDKKLYKEYVLLTENQHTKLLEDYGDKVTTSFIERLNDYIGSSGKKYKSHYHTILTWMRKDNVQKLELSPQELYERQVRTQQ